MSADPLFAGATPSPEAVERLRALPKVERHQHVDGSIPAEVTWELMRHYRLHPADSLPEMRRFLEIQDGEEGTLLAYLDKMHYPLWVTARSPSTLQAAIPLPQLMEGMIYIVAAAIAEAIPLLRPGRRSSWQILPTHRCPFSRSR